MRKKSRFAALFMTAAIILSGCEDIGEISLVGLENKQERERVLSIGSAAEIGIETEKDVFNVNEDLAIEMDNGGKPFGSSKIVIRYLYKTDGVEQMIEIYESDIDPLWGWTTVTLTDLSTGEYKIRVYIGEDEFFGEKEFSVVE